MVKAVGRVFALKNIARVAELVDASDLKSVGAQASYQFKSGRGHQIVRYNMSQLSEDEARKLIDEQVKELSMAHYEGEVKSLAIVYVNKNNDMKVLLTISANMQLAMVGAVNLLDFEVKTLVQKECQK